MCYPIPAVLSIQQAIPNGCAAQTLGPSQRLTLGLQALAGNHTITAMYSGDAQYQSCIALPMSQDVTPAPLTVTAVDATQIYGQANPAFAVTYVGFVNGDRPSSLTALPVPSTSATTRSPAGVYLITMSGAASPNYTITYNTASFTITKATASVTPNAATNSQCRMIVP